MDQAARFAFLAPAAGYDLRAVKVCLRNSLGGLYLIENFSDLLAN